MDAQASTDAEDRRDLEACGSGDRGALERLYRRHAPRVYGLALRSLRRRDLAEDVVQETFLSVQRAAGTFRGDAKVGTWICAIALNAVRMRMREDRKTPLGLEAAENEAAPDSSPPEAPARARALEAALAKVTPEQREILLLAAQGLAYEEIGEAIGVSAVQVRGRLFRARKDLLAKMGAEGRVDA